MTEPPGILFRAFLILSFKPMYPSAVRSAPKVSESPPTFSEMDMLLSFSTMMMFDFNADALFRASYARPPVKAPSPITATIFSSVPLRRPA